MAATGPSAKNAIDFLTLAQNLKTTKRTGWVRKGVCGPESIADHMYRMGLMALIASDAGVDYHRCIKLALVHDVAEAIVGDITPHCKINAEEKYQLESDAIEKIRNILGEHTFAAQEIHNLWHEYEAQSTTEAALVKDFDQLEMILQAFEYESKQNMNLEEFFTSTVDKFKTDVGKSWAAEVISRRQDMRIHNPPPVSTASTTERPSVAERSGPRIFVGKLAPHIQESDLQTYFMQYGQVTDVYLPKYQDNKMKHRGFGFVAFREPASVQRVVATQHHVIRDCSIVVDDAAPATTASGDHQDGASTAGGTRHSSSGPTRIFVGKLPWECTEADVRDYFCQFGTVTDVYMPKKNENKSQHRGFGFVTFGAEDAVVRVTHQPVHRIKNAVIAIDSAAPRTEENSFMGTHSSGYPGFGGAGRGYGGMAAGFTNGMGQGRWAATAL